MTLDCVANFGTNIRLQVSKVFDRFGSQYDFVAHSGHIMARLYTQSKQAMSDSQEMAFDLRQIRTRRPGRFRERILKFSATEPHPEHDVLVR